ncbi:MAG TPA: hypothetical protein PLE45_10260 [Spirochaetota bacterium]|nr:hypothetical protein [Spirochaetota bacterium]HOL57599.1 hypothetical protein [Spirochaetota bacterium]HPP05096.1 hypothetical protein [Spirochaetota bacterium]
MIKKILLINVFFSFNLLFAWDFTLDMNEDGKIDRWVKAEVMKSWDLFDVNKNRKADESCFYVSNKNIVYLIEKEQMDSNGNGKPDVFIEIKTEGRDFYREISIDSNSDEKIDTIYYEKNEFRYMAKYDLNYDGSFDSIEEYTKGNVEYKKELIMDKWMDIEYSKVIVKKSEDTNNDGKYDSFFTLEKFFRGGKEINEKSLKEEFDSNGDGKIDIWVDVVYNTNGSTKEIIIKMDTNFDGKVDEWRYANEKREVIRIEKDKDFDGKVDEIINNPKRF